jgi:hypothetical protein
MSVAAGVAPPLPRRLRGVAFRERAIGTNSVDVTDSAVVGKFSSQNAAIPNEDVNPCFARL